MFRMCSTLFLLTVISAPVAFAATPPDTAKVLSDPVIAVLTDARCAEVKTESTSEVTCFLSFPDSVPQLFYDVNQATGEMTIKLLNTTTGGFVLKDEVQPVNQGPVTSMVIREEILNKNEAMNTLTPEWYSVVLVKLSFNPMIRRQEDIVVSEMENAITISFPWPDKQTVRRNYYMTVTDDNYRKKVLIASLIGVGTVGLAGGGYYAYKHYFSDDANAEKPPEPVMPDHPSTP